MPTATPATWADTAGILAHLQISRRTLDRWIHRGLPCFKPVGELRFDLVAVDRWVRKVGTRPVKGAVKA